MILLNRKVEHFWNQTKPVNNCQKSTFWHLWYENSLQPNGLVCQGTLCGTLNERPIYLSISHLKFQKCNLARIRSSNISGENSLFAWQLTDNNSFSYQKARSWPLLEASWKWFNLFITITFGGHGCVTWAVGSYFILSLSHGIILY